MKSWIAVHPESHFPIQNLPFGIFSTPNASPRCGVAIGEFVIDMLILHQWGLLNGLGFDTSVFGQPTLNAFMATDRSCWRATRARLTDLLSENGDPRLRENEDLQKKCIVPMNIVQMHLPATIGDYTDFYSSREHATNVGIMFRGVDNALQPNWLHLPVGYHGRASSVVVSGTEVVRPSGQLQKSKENPKEGSTYGPCRLMDFELEMAFFVGGKPNPLGKALTIEEAEEHIFGVVMMNDWSARDIQAWEYVPLGPFTAKNFATSISPWVVSLDALEPFRCSSSAGPEQTDPNPTPLPYINDPNYATGAYDIKLEVAILPENQSTPSPVTRSNFRHLYWNMRQQLVHHSVTGCPMMPGDLLGSGTISGADESAFGSMLELSWRGSKEVPLVNSSGEVRKFLKDGDDVIMSGYAEASDGSFRVGFGAVTGRVLPAGTPRSTAEVSTCSTAKYGDFKLYSYWRSTSSWRVRIALALKGIPYETIPVDLSKLVGNTDATLPDEFRNGVNGMAQVPALEFSDASGTVHRLTQSMAILDFLDETFSSPPLLPVDPLARARARQIAEVINSGIQPMQNLSVLRQVKDVELLQADVGESGVHTDGRGFAKSSIEKGLKVVEQLVSAIGGGSSGKFAAGTEYPTVADITIVPQLYNADRFGVDLSSYPSLVAVRDFVATHYAFQAAAPDAQPDAPK
eukprot:CAMPEP_0185024984 /NCGR_PEP_ID=MMETSP1103-20130426/8119_1 /TAXON_ID=36769 /ORGANISM="Paraphysomonas bandaiensis, Strain Caron Lab Isolate" /LENGTH=686 /DNA_ID=CAMNT_0027558089 /DNA_START=53 /DNA_END=2113 /DNA_ORIENTATION=-